MTLPITKAKVRLTSAIDSSSTTVSFTGVDTNRSLTSVAMSDFGTYGFLIVNPTGKANNYECIRFASWSVSGSIITVGTLVRNVILQGSADTAGTGLSFPAGTIAVIGTDHHWLNHVVRDEGAQTIAGVKTFTSLPVIPTPPVSSTDAASKAYVDGVAVAGAPDASTTVKGLVEEATDAELQAGTGAGGTSARLFAGGASHNQTAAANKVPVAKSNAKLDDGWIGLTTAGDIVYSDGTDLQRLAATTARFLRMNGTTPEWGGANLDEANTFFGATDITGAEAETLSSASSSDAQSLHTHGNLSQRQHSFSTLVNVVNTTTETTILTKSIPGGILGTANALFGKIFISNINLGAGSDKTLTLRLKYGGSTIATITLVNNTGGSLASYEGKIEFDILASGATGTQTGHIEAYISTSAGSITNTADRYAFDLNVGTSAVDSTSAQTLLVTAQWSGASPQSDVSFNHGWVEGLRG